MNSTHSPSLSYGRASLIAAFFAVILTGCQTVYNNNLQVNTSLGKVVTGGSVLTPLGSQPVAGQWVADIPKSSAANTVGIAPYGLTYDFTGVTSAYTSSNVLAGTLTNSWPTQLLVSNARMPAYWNFQWEHPSYCINVDTPPYPLLSNPATYTNLVELPTTKVFWTPANPQRNFNCYINSPANPDFASSEVSPQFALDDALPSTLLVHAFSPINAAPAVTNLRLFSMSLTNPTNVTAISVASDGSSAIFPYPKASNGNALPAGPYVTTITTDPVGASQTTNGMEPIYIAHDDTSYTSAFGVAVANPKYTTIYSGAPDTYGDGTCAGQYYSHTYISGGDQIPLVTLPTLGKLALGSASQTVSVGSNPTVVVPYNDQTVSTNTQIDQCNFEYDEYTGAQSALVVNTGSNTVSLVSIGSYNYPSGTVNVGTSPVAAVIDPSESLAYIANYGDSTISEVDLGNVHLTRTLGVMTHPTSVAFDSNGNLWVGGQGNLQMIDRTNWAVWTTFPIDGTVTGMSYDTAQGAFVSAVLKNGTASSPSSGLTLHNAVAFSTSGGVSYSTTSLVNVATGNSTTSSIAADTAPYAQSSMASYLAFPGQTAFNPPIYTSSSGDLIATANGDTFTVSVLSTGKVLVSGTTPHPIRGIALTPTKLYLTMPESNSLVTLPIQLP